jgi:hypothetical protein
MNIKALAMAMLLAGTLGGVGIASEEFKFEAKQPKQETPAPVPGPQGEKGEQGAQGAPGAPGLPGLPGEPAPQQPAPAPTPAPFGGIDPMIVLFGGLGVIAVVIVAIVAASKSRDD